ncbi:hypothetical protein MM326_15165 [Alkalihalobacillus sp. LMS6]|uniref:hypothetical protein n=1 Tax=Alkalihalobacillus sp. LMS6 TaxID=2924034 RepID=UPI0020D1E59D|nr:hypothetical protein [Alkalihalobacillus sp. LMS6]UTR05436.1 hypothetical protein MM326_15165 [Alkalihalobacillus sp. LMS6]
MNTTLSLTGILKMSPLVLGGYGLVVGAGVLLVGGALLERELAKRSKVVNAEMVAGIIKIIMPIGFIAGLIYFVLSNPLL